MTMNDLKNGKNIIATNLMEADQFMTQMVNIIESQAAKIEQQARQIAAYKQLLTVLLNSNPSPSERQYKQIMDLTNTLESLK